LTANEAGMGFLIRLIVNAIALIAITYLPLGIHVDGYVHALVAALILGIVNAILRPILIIISLPLEIITLGLFTFVINGLLFWLVASIPVIGLHVDGFWSAFWGALIMGIVSWILSLLTRGPEQPQRR
jgi:putative membrane protein